jgi:hypothetical protein
MIAEGAATMNLGRVGALRRIRRAGQAWVSDMARPNDTRTVDRHARDLLTGAVRARAAGLGA